MLRLHRRGNSAAYPERTDGQGRRIGPLVQEPVRRRLLFGNTAARDTDPNAAQDVYPHQVTANKVILELARKHNIKVIATNDVHFVNAEDAEAHDRLICLSTGKDLDDPKRMRYTKQEWMKTTAEMNAIFSDIPEALSNTLEIADKVEFYSIDHGPIMPTFAIPEDFGTEEGYRQKIHRTGFVRRIYPR